MVDVYELSHALFSSVQNIKWVVFLSWILKTDMPSLYSTLCIGKIDGSLLKKLVFMGNFADVAPHVMVNDATSEESESNF